ERLVHRDLVFQPGHRYRAVALIHVDQPHALRGPPDLRDAAGLGAKDHPLFGDEEQLLGLEHARNAHDLAVPPGGLNVDDARPATALQAVLIDGGPLAVAVLGHGQDGAALAQHFHPYKFVVLGTRDAADAVRGPAHGPDVILLEPDRYAVPGSDEDVALAVGQLHAHQRISVVHADGDDTPGAGVAERRQLGFLHRPLAGAHHDEPLRRVELADRQQRRDLLVRLHRHEVRDRLALAGRHDIRDLVDLEPVAPPLVRENQDVAVRRRHEQVVDDVLFARAHADASAAATALAAVLGDGRALDVAGRRDGDRDVLVGDQIFDAELALGVHDGRAARVL